MATRKEKFYMDNVPQKLELFNNKEFGEVRALEVDGAPYFVAKDIAEALGYANPNDAISKHCKGVAKRYPLQTAGGVQEARIISEGDVYRLIASSKLEGAQKFESWVFDSVIPQIRKHGAYATPATIENIINNPDFGIELLQKLKEEQVKRKQVELENEEMKPKAIFADAVSVSDDAILIGALAKLLKQNGVEIGQKRLFLWLRENGYLVKDGRDKNIPTQRAMELKLFKVKERTITNPDGSSRLTRTTLVTGKGQQYFVNKFLGGATA